ncbi:MAG: hypothetical protein V1898_01765 [Patescibacteria group bacterium]
MKNNHQGSILIAVMVFGVVFIISFSAIASLVITGHRLIQQKTAREKAFQIAEAGLNYYRWQLAHNLEDFDGVSNVPYYDPSGDLIGYYSVTAEPIEYVATGSTVTLCHKPETAAERTLTVADDALPAHLAHGDYEGECGGDASINFSTIAITATGWTPEYPNSIRIVKALYGRPSLAKYAYVSNSNIWFGSSENITGTVHANGGIRMDGTCNSLITSTQETYICGSEHGCSDEEKPGIWGSSSRSDLWDFPIANGVDFDAITVDLENIKTLATAEGVYLPPSGAYGYLITFSDSGSIDVRKVTKLQSAVLGHNGTDWVTEAHSYKNTSNVGTYEIPDNGLIFVEDDVWVEGVVDGRATLAAARLPDGSYTDASIFIQNNIEYDLRDGSSVLGLIAQKDILIPLYAPNELIIDAALLAQKGHVFRYYYPSSMYSQAIRSSIETYGTIITNTVWTFSWVSSADGPVISGYQNTSSVYDPYLLYGPPPSFPSGDEYEFISWEEILPNEEG